MIEPGKYYKLVHSMDIIQAELCTFCALKNVVSYKYCLFKKRGMLKFPRGYDMLPLVGCIDSPSVIEVTEAEYMAFKIDQLY
jgi:hypothetical protein